MKTKGNNMKIEVAIAFLPNGRFLVNGDTGQSIKESKEEILGIASNIMNYEKLVGDVQIDSCEIEI